MRLRQMFYLALRVFPIFFTNQAFADFAHWCEDLLGSPEACRGNSALVQELGADEEALRSVLNDKLWSHVERCEKLRKSSQGMPIASYVVQTCQFQSPLYGFAKDLRFIRHDEKPAAALPRSGARLVVDCDGRHLQLWGDLPREKQHALLRIVFDKVSATGLQQQLQSIRVIGSNDARIEARSCPLELGNPVKSENFRPSVWVFGPDHVRMIEAAEIPLAYLAPKCAPAWAIKNAHLPAEASPQPLLISKIDGYRETKMRLKAKRFDCTDICRMDGDDSSACSICREEVQALQEKLEGFEDILEPDGAAAAVQKSF